MITSEMLERYLDRRWKDLEAARLAFLRSDFKSLERIGHQNKGSGASYGYEELTRWGTDLEDAAKAKNLELSGELIEKLSIWLRQTDPRQSS